MAGVEHSDVSNEEFIEEVARYEWVYHRNSKDLKDENKKANSWEKAGEKLYLSTAEAEVKFHNIKTASLSEAIENATFWIGARLHTDHRAQICDHSHQLKQLRTTRASSSRMNLSKM